MMPYSLRPKMPCLPLPSYLQIYEAAQDVVTRGKFQFSLLYLAENFLEVLRVSVEARNARCPDTGLRTQEVGRIPRCRLTGCTLIHPHHRAGWGHPLARALETKGAPL